MFDTLLRQKKKIFVHGGDKICIFTDMCSETNRTKIWIFEKIEKSSGVDIF